MKIRHVVLFLVCFFIFGFGKICFALSVSPVLKDLTLNPGDSTEVLFTVTNETEVPRVIRAKKENFFPEVKTRTPYFDKTFDVNQKNILLWTTLSIDSFTLLSNESREISMKIDVPENAAGSSYYFAILWESFPYDEENFSKKNLTVHERIASLFFTTVLGDIKVDLEVIDFGVEYEKFLFSRHPESYDFTLKNTGNVILQPSGAITRNGFFGQGSRFIINPTGKRLIPGETSEFVSENKKTFPLLGYSFTFWKSLSQEFEYFGFGPYGVKAHIDIGPLGFEKRITQEWYYWIFPWRIILFPLFLLTIFLFSFIRTRKARRKFLRKVT